MRFMFWNVGRRSRAKARLVAQVALGSAVDVLLLAEADFDAELSNELNASGDVYWFPPPIPDARLRLHTRLPSQCVDPLAEKNFLAAFHVKPPSGCDLLLVVAHFASKLHLDTKAQASLTPRIRDAVEKWEGKLGHSRTVVVGDFNMNPFEDGVVGSEGLHAVMTRADARRRSRRVYGERRRFFYNPMWRHFGDRDDGPPGTYRHNGSGPHTIFWNIFDQVMIRPELLDHFADESVRIVTRVGHTSLATRTGRPNGRAASDHFPIVFDIEEQEKEQEEKAVANG